MTEKPFNRPLAFGVVGLGLVTFGMGQTILFAILGPLGRVIGLSELQVGSIPSIAALTIALVSPFWGRRSNEWGRRVVIFFGLAVYGVTMGLFAFLGQLGLAGAISVNATYLSLVGVRLVYASLSAGIQPAATAYIADITVGRERTAGLALVGGALALGTVLGPAMGALLAVYGLLVPIYAVAVLAFLAAIATLTLLPGRPRTEKLDHEGKLAFHDRRILAHLFMMFGILVAGSSTQLTAAFYIQDLLGTDEMRTTQLVGLAMACAALAMIVAQGGLVQFWRPSPKMLVWSGLALALLGFVVLGTGAVYWHLLIGYVVLGLGTGLMVPGVLSAGSFAVPDSLQGDVAGLMTSAQAAGFVVGPLLGSWLYGFAPVLTIAVNGLITLVLLVLAFATRFPETHE